MSLFSRKKTNRVKPARKKKASKKPVVSKITWKMPDFRPLLRLLKGALVVGAVGFAGVVSWRVLDRPVKEIEITGPWQRVRPMQVEDYVRSSLGGGVLSGDLEGVRKSLEALDWVDTVRIRRGWPTRLSVELTEQVAAARWGETGLLNTRGELFVSNARHIPAELPVLRGPDGAQWQVAQRYLALRTPLLEEGLQLLGVTLNERGSWKLTLAHGIEVRLGANSIDDRIDRLISVVTPIIAGRTEAVDYVDLRYSNGFAIGWHEHTKQTEPDSEQDEPAVLAELDNAQD